MKVFQHLNNLVRTQTTIIIQSHEFEKLKKLKKELA